MLVLHDPFESLILALHSASAEERRQAAETLRQRGEPGGHLSAETLIQVLLQDSTPLRQAAADILREWRDAVPVEPLFLALRDADQQVRSASMWALAEVGEYAPQERLLPHLADADPMVRTAVLYALGRRAPGFCCKKCRRCGKLGLIRASRGVPHEPAEPFQVASFPA